MGITWDNVEYVGIIGAGKIGSAIIVSLKNCYPNLKIYATGRRESTLENARKLGAISTKDNDLAVRESDIVILSVKPHHFPTVIRQVEKSSWRGKIVISVMAGVRLSTLNSVLENSIVYRAMPNINVVVKKSSTAIAYSGENPSKYKDVVENIFRCMGSVYWVPEEFLDIWTALSGSGPAFIAEIVDALVLGAVACGMPRELAYKSILDVLEGTSILLRSTSRHPLEIRDEVTTPAGTTIKGLMTLESEGVKAALMKTIQETFKRSQEIGDIIDNNIRKTLGIK